MKILRTIRNYFFYCGIEKKDYNELKRDAYISNFKVWRVLHFLMVAVFGVLFASSLISDMMEMNRVFYLVALVYSVLAVVSFFLSFEKGFADRTVHDLPVNLYALSVRLFYYNK